MKPTACTVPANAQNQHGSLITAEAALQLSCTMVILSNQHMVTTTHDLQIQWTMVSQPHCVLNAGEEADGYGLLEGRYTVRYYSPGVDNSWQVSPVVLKHPHW
jgi:hypothetical protein